MSKKTLSNKRKELFDIMIKKMPTAGRIYRIIKEQDRGFISRCVKRFENINDGMAIMIMIEEAGVELANHSPVQYKTSPQGKGSSEMMKSPEDTHSPHVPKELKELLQGDTLRGYGKMYLNSYNVSVECGKDDLDDNGDYVLCPACSKKKGCKETEIEFLKRDYHSWRVVHKIWWDERGTNLSTIDNQIAEVEKRIRELCHACSGKKGCKNLIFIHFGKPVYCGDFILDKIQLCEACSGKVKPIILDDNELSIMKYAEEYPENWKKICKALDKSEEKQC